ncbi:MAG TPA: glycosyltransferase family 2 protein [Bacteriovoracaceae bacterium]|nr:glycosyltransferase family 2 protein [Bacteriovoracaceae bacterium]
MNKLISIVTPCYNEEDNVEGLYAAVKAQFQKIGKYDYEHIFIDNASGDKTVEILKKIASQDSNVKVIVNSRNFGHIRSPFHGLVQASGDAVMLVVADFQDPPELIPEFISKWENGHDIVIGIKNQSLETPLMFFIRKCYYTLVSKLSEIELAKNFTGFGLYDRKIIKILRELNDPYPYFRGIILELGFRQARINYIQPVRKRGITKNNFYTLYDIAMLGICNHSKVPLRLATILGFSFSVICFMIALGYLVAKLIFWDKFALGIAPIVIGIFFVSSIQLFVLGIVGEYVGWVFTRVSNRKLVYEQERVNF